MAIGERIRKLRLDRNWSQADLAAAVDESKSSVSRWEEGTSLPELDQLIHLSMLFEISLSDLLGEQVREYDMEEQTDPKKEKEKQKKDKILLAVKLLLLLAVLLLGVLVNMVWFRFLLRMI